ncbi:hypothetical protein [Streptomyces sp. YGL11-2]|uniref:hypothetical protein n=1 Tax=Streptomyces sp. YGL11-2 TaxID=3414028 RepID=UPI003CF45279
MRTFALGTLAVAVVINFVALQRSFVPYAGASGMTSSRPVSASNATAWTCPVSSVAAARMSSNWARAPPPAAGATMPRSVIIMPIMVPSPSGSRPSRRTTTPVRRFGFCLRAPPFFFAASRAANATTPGWVRQLITQGQPDGTLQGHSDWPLMSPPGHPPVRCRLATVSLLPPGRPEADPLDRLQ